MIPTWIIALIALGTGITAIVFRNARVSVGLFAIAALFQFGVYLLFSLIDVPIETRQYISRSNIITSNLITVIIIVAGVKRHGK